MLIAIGTVLSFLAGFALAVLGMIMLALRRREERKTPGEITGQPTNETFRLAPGQVQWTIRRPGETKERTYVVRQPTREIPEDDLRFMQQELRGKYDMLRAVYQDTSDTSEMN